MMSQQQTQPHVKVLADPRALVEEAARRIVAAAQRSDEAGDLFALFLSGGSTPRALYQLLAGDNYRDQIDWRNVEIYFGDERCVPSDSAESNFRMANDALISKISIPATQVYRIRGEIDPNEAAKEYGTILKEHFDDEGPTMMLLGMGADGHTASIFPGTEAVNETEHRCVATNVPHDYVPKGTNWRITTTFPFINRSSEVMIMVTGKDKQSKVQEVLSGRADPEQVPIARVQPVTGTLTWLLDQDAHGGPGSS
jgi:6-phosphogluconolactonase